jgi:LL-diaminopimelate aminotransferase
MNLSGSGVPARGVRIDRRGPAESRRPLSSPDMRSTNITPTTSSTAAPSRRLAALPTYVFAWLDDLKAAARARRGAGATSLVDLGIGNPDQPTPPEIVDAIAAAYRDPRTHGYPPFRGTETFRRAAADFMRARFGVVVDWEREVLCVSGGKEGIAQLVMGYTDESSTALVPNIHYPVHGRASGLVGGRVHLMPIAPERGYLPDLSAIPAQVVREARLLMLNYPHNPTGAVATVEFFDEAVTFCARHGLVLLSDLAYSEITFDGFVAPSVLEVPGAAEVAIEIHSLSKSFNMAGARLGFAVGNPDLIDTLYAVRTNMGYGTPAAIQAGGAYALAHAGSFTGAGAARYRERRDAVVEGFRSLGWPADPPRATMFVWLPVPAGFTSQGWTEHLIDETGVVVTPGNAFGPGGEGFFRVSLVGDSNVLRDAVERLRRAGIRFVRR